MNLYSPSVKQMERDVVLERQHGDDLQKDELSFIVDNDDENGGDDED